jgi:nucleoside-diphosphate-sugar epimerase
MPSESPITVVTGATGHIGANLVRELLRRGRRLRVLVERGAAEDTRAIDGLELERVVGDVRERESLRPLFAGADVVYHLAAVIALAGDRAGRLHDVNVAGAENVAELAREAGVRRMVHFSSIHAFDSAPAGEPIDEKRARALGARPGASRVRPLQGAGRGARACAGRARPGRRRRQPDRRRRALGLRAVALRPAAPLAPATRDAGADRGWLRLGGCA